MNWHFSFHGVCVEISASRPITAEDLGDIIDLLAVAKRARERRDAQRQHAAEDDPASLGPITSQA